MKKLMLVLLAVTAMVFAAPKPVYPIIFVHGLVGSDETFEDTMRYLNDTLEGETSEYQWGNINSYDAVLNFDNNHSTSNLVDDVKWYNCFYNDKYIRLGRRNFEVGSYVEGWDSNSLIFAINFKEERIEDADQMGFDDYFNYSDQSAIYKQGYALGKMIGEVLGFTQAEKVILVGHSMGGLVIREYLQRTVDGSTGTNHRWWVDPSDNINGHAVARVVTIGTPHLGSNSGFDPSKSLIPDKNSEAMRDLKYLYNSNENGVYLFGGNEEYNTGLGSYVNRDVDCNGIIGDGIIGLSQLSPRIDNQEMPLPNNIRYTWITSDTNDGEQLVIGSGPGDGCVLLERQSLYHIDGNDIIPAPMNLADTLLIHTKHTDEGSDYESILRGLDEPDTKELAYVVEDGLEYSGTITYNSQITPSSSDFDLFKLENDLAGEVTINIKRNLSGVYKFFIFEDDDGTYNLVKDSVIAGDISYKHKLVYDGDVYLGIQGAATSTSFQHPYSFSMHFEFIYANLVVLPATMSVSMDKDKITQQRVILSNKGNVNITYDISSINSWIDLTGSGGIIPAGEYVSINVNFDSNGLSYGSYNGNIRIKSNDDDNPQVDIPVTLNVENMGEPIYISGGTISKDSTWVYNPGGYVITGNITVYKSDNNPRLKIAAGNTIKFESDAGLSVGNGSTYRGELHAVGTPDSLITFTPLNGSIGGWYGITFNDGSDYVGATSRLTNCIVEKGNAHNIYCTGTNQPAIDHCMILNSANTGIKLYDSPISISNSSTVLNKTGIYITNSPLLLDNVVIDNNSEEELYVATPNTFPAFTNFRLPTNGSKIVVAGGTISTNSLWPNFGLDYEITGNITVYKSDNNPRLKIAAGNTIKFESDAGLSVGNGSTYRGELHAVGTPDSLITFTPLNGSIGGWYGITFNDGSDYVGATSRLTNCIVEKGNAHNIYCTGTNQPAIDHCLIRNSSGYGVSFSSSTPVFRNNKVVDNGTRGMYLSGTSAPVIGDELQYSCQFYGNGTFDIYNDTANNIYARNNDWNSTNTDSISARIYDKSDNAVKGIVYFTPYVNQPDLHIEITDLQHANYVGGVWVPVDVVINETDSVRYSITGSDPDGNPLTYLWKFNGTEVCTTPLYILRTGYESGGNHTVTLEVSDNFGSKNTEIFTWNLQVKNVNRSPVILTHSPVELDFTVNDATEVDFSINAEDPDHQVLLYSWLIDEEVQTATDSLFSMTFAPNNHIVKCIVSDGELTDSLSWNVLTTGIEEPLIPKETKLYAAYPNPFNPETNIKFGLKENSMVKISVLNIKGQLIKNLVNKNLRAGYHVIKFNADNLTTGSYFIRMNADNKEFIQKIMLIE